MFLVTEKEGPLKSAGRSDLFYTSGNGLKVVVTCPWLHNVCFLIYKTGIIIPTPQVVVRNYVENIACLIT